MSSLAKKMETPTTKGITIEEIKMVIAEEVKSMISLLNKQTLILSTIDNRLAGIEKRLENNKPAITTTTATTTVSTTTPKPTMTGKYELPVKASQLISNTVDFVAIADLIYHKDISFDTFKASWIDKAKELGKSIKSIIPSVKSKEVWEAVEKGFSSQATTKVLDKTNQVTLTQTLFDAGINLDKLNKGLEQFKSLLEPDMFTESKFLTLDNYRYILSRLDINIRDNAPCNTDSNLRKYVSEVLYNAMTTN